MTIPNRLATAERQLRRMGHHTAADTAARFQAQIATGKPAFLFERFTADLEGVVLRGTAEFYGAMAAEAKASGREGSAVA